MPSDDLRISVRRVPSILADVEAAVVARRARELDAFELEHGRKARLELEAAQDRAVQDLVDVAVHGARFETVDGRRIDPLDVLASAPPEEREGA